MWKDAVVQYYCCFNCLSNRFLGNTTVPLSADSLNEHWNRLNIATEEQWRIMPSAKQWIAGPAGSGKTWLLKQKVQELARKCLMHDDEPEHTILVLCFHRPLAQHLENEFRHMLNSFLQVQEDNHDRIIVQCMTYDKFVNTYLGSTTGCSSESQKEEVVLDAYRRLSKGQHAPCTFQHIFVDEGQDFYGSKWPEVLKFFLQDEDDDSFEPHYFWVMFDSNQIVQRSTDSMRWFSKYLRNATKLTKVVRNTRNIFNASTTHYSSTLCTDIELGHSVSGLEVKWDHSLPETHKEKQKEGPKLVAKHIQDLFRRNVKPNDICVLTKDVPTGENLCADLVQKGIPSQNAEHESLTSQDSTKCIFVESIRRFKGLESKVVILHDPTSAFTKTRSQLTALLYSGITRCTCYLIILSTKRDCELIRSGPLSPSRKRAAEPANKGIKAKKSLY